MCAGEVVYANRPISGTPVERAVCIHHLTGDQTMASKTPQSTGKALFTSFLSLQPNKIMHKQLSN
jgi:hypothetical protein